MTRGGKSIVWKQWKDAFNWDQSNFSLPLHERLTLAHIELDPASRMRNHLAEDVLDSKMLFMMQVSINSDQCFHTGKLATTRHHHTERI